MNPAQAPSQETTIFCPFFGLTVDPETPMLYPSMGNACHRCRPVATPAIEHQSEYCLTVAHNQCPVFQAPPAKPMPPELRMATPAQKISPLALWVALSILVIALAVLAFFFLRRDPASPTPALPPPELTRVEPSHTPTLTPSPRPTITPLPPTATATPRPTFTPTPFFAALDSAIGSEQKFLIHRMLEGENLQLLASRNGTSPDAIVKSTYRLAVPVWAGKLVVIPLNLKDPSGFPAFEPYQIGEASITLAELAGQLVIDVNLLEKYNACPAGCILRAGSWILIPRQP